MNNLWWLLFLRQSIRSKGQRQVVVQTNCSKYLRDNLNAIYILNSPSAPEEILHAREATKQQRWLPFKDRLHVLIGSFSVPGAAKETIIVTGHHIDAIRRVDALRTAVSTARMESRPFLAGRCIRNDDNLVIVCTNDTDTIWIRTRLERALVGDFGWWRRIVAGPNRNCQHAEYHQHNQTRGWLHFEAIFGTVKNWNVQTINLFYYIIHTFIF